MSTISRGSSRQAVAGITCVELNVHIPQAFQAVSGLTCVEFDVYNLAAIHMVLDEQGAAGAQVKEGYHTALRAHSQVQAGLVKAEGRQSLTCTTHTKWGAVRAMPRTDTT